MCTAGGQHQTGRDFTASDGGHQLFQFGNLADVGALVDKAAHMDRQPPAVHIVGFFAEQIEFDEKVLDFSSLAKLQNQS